MKRIRLVGNSRVIANFQPTYLGSATIIAEFRALMQEILPRRLHERLGSAQLRGPGENRSLANDGTDGITHWHWDASHQGYFVVWSNLVPTEVQLADGKRLKVKSGDVILVNNATSLHRLPRAKTLRVRQRWFVRLYLFGDYD